jgi:hypothetical protein
MFNELKLFTKLFFVITVLFTVFLYLLSIILEPAIFYLTQEGMDTSMIQLPSIPIWILSNPVRIPVQVSVGTVFLFLWVAVAVSFVAAWVIRENFHKVIKETVTKPVGKLFRSSLFAMPILNSMTLIAVIAIQSIQEAGGIPTGTAPLQGNPFADFVDLSYASVVEELCFRIIPIGVLIFIYLLVIGRKSATFPAVSKIKLFFTSILFPDRAKRMVNTKTVEKDGFLRGISITEWGMVAFTTAVFGLAHFDPGVSWEIGKVSSAAFAGLVIALCYVVYGFHAAILMHWFFNVYIETFRLSSEYYPIMSPFASTVGLLTLILGLMGYLVTSVIVFQRLVRAIDERRDRKNQTMVSLTISPE